MVCEEEWQTCRFCYKITMHCSGGQVGEIEIGLVLPPGHPFYSGTPQEDPEGPMENLEIVGDTNTLVTENVDCDGRQWYTMDLNFGRVDPITMLSPSQQDSLYGWPQYTHHVFGGCCWDFVALAGGVCTSSYNNNSCACLGLSGAGLDACRQSLDFGTPRSLVKISWNCLNEPLGL
jgi:hypothetical protein